MKRAEENDSQTFAFYKDQKITLGEFNEKSNRVANSLLRLGVRKGQNVAIISHSCLDYLICEYGIFKSGAVCVPINCLLKSQELSYLLDNADIVLVIVHRNYLQEFQNSQANNQKSKIPFYTIEEAGDYERSFSRLLDGDSTSPKAEVGYEDPCFILYTSGTTGRPKGVVYENYGMVPLRSESYVQQMMDVIQLGQEDTTYLPFALYHILGQVHVIGALRNGGRIALAERFSVSQFWNDVRNYEATVLVHQGASIPLLLKQPPSQFDRKHRARLSVGAGVPSEEIWRAFEERFSIKIFEHYAQTEGSLFGAGTMPSNKIGTIGPPYLSAEIRIVDENDADVGRGEPGQLISRLKPEHAKKTPQTLYYKEAEKGLLRFTKDGWFRSGDIIRIDEAGYLHYVGKMETFIRYRGENISPLQIESVLAKHPAIEECIAVGVPNQEFGGDDIKVVIVAKKDAATNPMELTSWCEKVLPKYMMPRYVEFVPELKKTEQTKKILRNDYRENSPGTWDRLRQKGGS